MVTDDEKAKRQFKTLRFESTGDVLDAMKEEGMIGSAAYKEKLSRLTTTRLYRRRRKL